MAESLEVVDDPLDRRHHAPTGGPGAPHAVEERLGEDQVPGGVGRRGVHECHVGRQGLEQAERAERGVDDA